MKKIRLKQIQTEYFVSTTGSVFKLKKGTLVKMRTFKTKSGYTQVKIHNKSQYVHRLVAKAFIPNPNNKKEVNHINLNKSDNCVENLEWVTGKENCNHFRNNDFSSKKTSGRRGTLYVKGRMIAKFRSLQQAKKYCAQHLGFSLSTYRNINLNVKNQAFYVRDDGPSLEEMQNMLKQTKENVKKRVQKEKGYSGKVFKNGEYIGSFSSVREACAVLHTKFLHKGDVYISGKYILVLDKKS